MTDHTNSWVEPESLAQQLEQIASSLRDRKSGNSVPQEETGVSHRMGARTRSYADLARQIYRWRRERNKTFPPDLFGEPAWDMLLDLYISEAERRNVHVGSLCIGGCAPATTGLRWIALLEERGLVVRVRAEGDKRIVYVRLTATGRRLMHDYLQRASGAAGALPRLQVVR